MNLKEVINLAYKKINSSPYPDDNPPKIIDDLTIEFEWGYVFRYNSKKWVENKIEEYAYFRTAPVLVDKIDKSVHFVRQHGVIFDSELENYREKKGYSQSIKFPIRIDISEKSIIEQVKTLFRTGEIIQIQNGINLIETHKLLDLEEFKKITFNNAFPHWNFEEQIAAQFMHESVILNERIGSDFPNDLKIFNDSTKLSLSGAKINKITEIVFQLQNLERLEIWYSEVNEITTKLVESKTLKVIEILDSILGNQAEYVIEELKIKSNVEVIDYRKK